MNKGTTGKTSQDKHLKPQAFGPISARRLWLFRLIAVIVVPILLLLLLEVVLRVTGYGFPTSAFVRCTIKDRTVYCSNNKFGWLFFPPEISREFEPFIVPDVKADDTYRIFILGESAAQGAPDPAYCFGFQLRVMLRRQYPSVNFEVLTAAMPAINSHAVVRIAKDCARFKPDLFVVYMGNNEVIGPYGAGTIFTPLSKSLFFIRMGIATKATRLGELMTSLAGTFRQRPEHWGGLDMFLAKQIRQDDKQMQYVYNHFRRNLEDIIGIAQKSGARTIVSTIAVNLKDCPPFASQHRLNIVEQLKQFDAFYHRGIELEKAGDFNDAIDNYLSAAEIDDTYAELQFRMGRCRWNLGQFDKARENYARAMEFDTLRFRADSTINRIIREVSSGKTDQGVYFVDAASVFEQNSPDSCPGFELFLEHVHLNFSGNYLLARTIFDYVDQILPDTIKKQKSDDAVASETGCVSLIAFTDFDNLRITQENLNIISQQPTFVNQPYHQEIVNIWRQKTEQLKARIGPGASDKALEQYEQAIKLDRTSISLRQKYAKFLWEHKKDIRAAVVQYRLIVEQMPHDHYRIAELASMERMLGDIDSALKHAVRAVNLMPTNRTANYAAGTFHQAKGHPKQAKKYFVQTIKLMPEFPSGYIALANVLMQEGRSDEAIRVYRKGNKAVPDDASLHFNLSLLLRQKGQLEEAEKQLQKAISLDPNILEKFRQDTLKKGYR